MSQPLEQLKKVRLEKLKKLQNLGVKAYPAGWELLKSRILIQTAKVQVVDQKVVVAGRIMAIREHGKLIFVDLRDQSGEIQVSFRRENFNEKEWEIINLLDRGDFLGVGGRFYRTKTQELTIEVGKYGFLGKSIRPIPVEHFGLEDIETRYRQRYTDLIVNPQVKKVFLKRTQVVAELKSFLNEHGFVEVETPVLQPLYGGASARPFVTHHNALDRRLYLRISDELYLKRLVVGGFEKVYELGKDFRNEGIDRQHNPEFTQLEFYWAYADYETLMKFTEEMLTAVIKKSMGKLRLPYGDIELDFSLPWRRITFRDLLYQETKIDIDKVNTEKTLLEAIQNCRIELELKGVVGYGALIDELYKKTCRQKLIQPTFLLDYPIEMLALAKKSETDSSKVASFQLLVKGFEVVKAYNELNDPTDQRKRWQDEMKLAKKGLKDHQVLDEDYIRALEYGMPPTAGWGLGIDRLAAILTNQPSIKDVILFPTLRPV